MVLFILLIISFVILFFLFGTESDHPPSPIEKVTFKVVDDGKYLVKYKDEKAVDDGILIILEISQGINKGTEVPLAFLNRKAKKITNESIGSFIGRLAYEGSGTARKLETIVYHGNNVEFLIRIADGLVASVYSLNEGNIKRFKKQLIENPNYIDNQPIKTRQTQYKVNKGHNFVCSFKLTRTPSNEINKVISSYDRSICYEVNLFHMTCSCPDFKKRRVSFDKSDVRRLCKHLYKKINRNNYLAEETDELTKVIMSYRPKRLKMIINYMASGEPVVFCYDTLESPWIDVFSRKRRKGNKNGKFTGEFERFGFSLEENRWSYGMGPPGAMEIRAMIKKNFGAGLES